MINKNLYTLIVTMLAMIMCCMPAQLLANGDESTSLKWCIVNVTCDFDVDVDVVDGFCGLNNGSATITVTGGVAPYTYDWDTGQTGPFQDSLGDQHYFVTVTDATGCSEVLDIDVDDESNLIDVDLYPEETTCGLDNGEININMEGGVLPYIYLWSNGSTDGDLSDLAPGIYCLTVTDQTGCSDVECIEVEEGAFTPFDIVVNTTPATCGEADGTATVTVSGGNSPYDYDWSNGEDNDEINDLEAGTYTLTITDDDDCDTIVTVTITDDCCPVITAVVEPDSCGLSIGQITVTATPPGSYGYTWSPAVSTTNVATGLPAGTYSVTVTNNDDPLCVNTASFVVGNNTDNCPCPVITAEVEPDSCGLSIGQITVTATPPGSYGYTWSPAVSTTNVATGLPAGTYSVTVTNNDDPLCVNTASFVVGNNTDNCPCPVITAEVEPDSCGLSIGQITVTATPPGSYGYTWSPAVSTTNVATGLPAGTYSVTVTNNDDPLCVNTASFVVGNNTDNCPCPVITAEVEPDSCGLSIGQITVTATPPGSYGYTWSPAVSTTNVATGLPAGTYSVTVTNNDDPLCVNTASFVVGNNTDNCPCPVITAEVEPDSCGLSIGGITVTATPPGSYGYTWSPAVSTTNVATGLPAGTYSVTVTNNDDTLCVNTASFVVGNNTDNCPCPVITAVVEPDSCGLSIGQITVTATPPGSYGYTWSPAVSTTNVATGLPAGTYSVTVTNNDDPLCVNTASFVVGNNTDNCGICPVISSIVILEPTCLDSTGEATITMIPAGSYVYTWTPNVSTTNVGSNLPPGTYSVEIISLDYPGCNTSETFTIGSVDGPGDVDITTTNEDCGMANGTATLTPAGYTYVWSDNGFIGNMRTSLPVGDYQVTVTDPNNMECPYVIPVSIEGNTFTLSVELVEPPCNEANGSATITPTPPGSYTYSWGPGNSINNLAAGIYCVTVVEDGTNCTNDICFTLNNDVDTVTITVTSSDVVTTCAGTNDGTVEFTVVPGTATQPLDTTIVNSNGIEYTNGLLPPGDYCIIITDAIDCVAGSSCFTVSEPDHLDVDIAVTPVTCDLDAIIAGSIELVNITGGTAPYTVAWPGGSGGTIYDMLVADDYTFTLTDANGCSVTDTVTVENNAIDCDTCLIITSVLIIQPTCEDSTGQATITISPPATTFTYTWTPNVSNTNVGTNLPSGTYTVEITDPSDPTCPVIDTTFIVNPPPTDCCDSIVITSTVIVEPTCIDATGEVTITVAPPGTYNYSGTDDDGNPFVINSGMATGLSYGTYYVTISDPNPDCPASAIDTFTIGTVNGPDVEIETTNAGCGLANGTATLTPAGYTYVWNDGFMGNFHIGLSAGNYQVTVTDSTSMPICPNVITVIIKQDMDLSITVETTPADCGVANGSATINVTGGSGFYTYTWSNNNTQGNTQGNLASQMYCVEVEDDSTSCEGNICFFITEIDSIPITVVATDTVISCAGSNDGLSVITMPDTLTVPGGPYTSTITDTIGNTYTNGQLAPGNYCVYVTNANGCNTGADCFVVFPVPQLDVDIAVTHVTCVNNEIIPGSIELLNIEGGTQPYDIEWSPTLPGGNPNAPLEAGDYSFTLTDANDCFVTQNLTVNSGSADCDTIICDPLVIVSTVIVEPTCIDATGEVTITVAPPGTYNYSGTDDDGNPFVITSGMATGLSYGTYYVTISDPNPDCPASAIDTFTIGTVNGPDVEIETTNADCGLANGTATLTPAGYTYVWNDGFMGNFHIGLSAGNYQVTVTDSTSMPICPNVITVIIKQDMDLSITVETTPADCGVANGSATINVTGGSGFYTYTWSNNNTQGNTQGNLASQMYCVEVEDDSTSCEGNICFFITEIDSIPITVVATDTVISCAGSNDGLSVITMPDTLTVPGGPYTSTITDTIGNTYTNGQLAPGNYCVYVTNANGCNTGADCFVVFPVPQLDVDIAVTHVTCVNNEIIPGSIELLNIEGGTQPYDIEWSPTLPGGNPNAPLEAGDYSFTLTDANDCFVTQNLTVNSGSADCDTIICDPLVIVSTVIVEPTCIDATGEVTITVAPPGTYNYSGTDDDGNPFVITSGMATGLSYGTYYVTISDPNPDCPASAIDTFTIGTVNGPDVEIETTNADCGLANGTATLTPAGYTYVWNDGFMGNFHIGLSAGNYQVTVTDSTSMPICPNVITVIIKQDMDLSITVETTPADCGVANGSATINVTGGSGFYTYTWSNNNTQGNTQGNLASQMYCVEVEDDSTSCEGNICFFITEIDSIPITVVATDTVISCAGSNDGLSVITMPDTLTVPGGPYTSTITDTIGNTYTNGQLAPGNYCVYVTNANGCNTGADCFVVSPAPQLDVDIAVTDGFCLNDEIFPGSIELENITGGTPFGGPFLYQIDWSPTGTPNDPVNSPLDGGDYSFTLTDANGCSIIDTVTVNVDTTGCPPIPPECLPLEITSIVIFEAHCDSIDGSATISINQDTTDYSFVWSPMGGPGPTGTNLAPDTYFVTITQLSNPECSLVDSFTIGTIEGPEPDLETTPASCGLNDGTAIFTDTLNLVYEWSCVPCTGDTVTGLAVGEYFVTIYDPADSTCINVKTVVIDEALSALDLTVVIDTFPDCGMANGVATIIASGGVPPYTYLWNTGDTTQTVSGLASGVYIVTVADANDCKETITVPVPNIIEAEVMIDTTDIVTTCAGSNDGTIQYTVTYSGNFNFPADTTIVDADGIVYTNGSLPPGDYCINIRDSVGCLRGSACFGVTSPSQIDVDIAVVDEVCDSLGSILLSNIVVSTEPYTIVWPGLLPVPNPIENPTGLQQGVYDFTLSDANGCSISVSVPLDSTANNIEIDFQVTPVSCQGDMNGSITAIPSGGQPDYFYEWNIGDTTQTISGLGIGVYIVTVTDASGCIGIDSVILTAPPPPPSGLPDTIITCEETILLIADTLGIYTVEWFSCDTTGLAGPDSLEITVLDTMCYYVEITDDSTGCVTKDSIVVIEAPKVMADFSMMIGSCADTADIEITDLSTTEPISFITKWDWMFSNGDSSDVQDPVVVVADSGEFVVTLIVCNNYGCTDTLTDSLVVNLVPTFSTPDTVYACPGDSVELFPDAPPGLSLTYSWSPADSLDNPTLLNPTSWATQNTTYTLTYTSADGLCQNTKIVELIFYPMLTLELEIADTILCESVNLEVSASTNGTEICWFDNPGQAGVPICGNSVDLEGQIPSDPFWYVVARDDNQCMIMDSLMIVDYSVGVVYDPPEICPGDTITIIPIYDLVSGVDHDFIWSPIGSESDEITVSPEVSTSYEVMVSNDFCEATESFEVMVRNVSEYQAFATPDEVIYSCPTQLEAVTPSNVSYTYTYSWSNSSTLDSNDIYNPIAIPLETTDYTVTITTNDSLACVGEATVRITVIDDCEPPYIFFPNAFSPNDDGHNDVLFLRGTSADEVHFVIYNRWGEKVYESFAKDQGWDGTYNGERLSSDVYGYHLRVRCFNGEEYVKKGNVTLLR